MAYFDNQTSKGELYDLEQELNSDEFETKLYAVKKIIANMTVGKDVSPLFQSVLKCLQYPDIQLKKLVYLYIINYSRDKPDDSIMVVNLFRKDMENKGNPLLRALAVRTIGCLRVHKLNEYLVLPLKNCLEDVEPYVRKTAALCVPKVYEVSPQLIEEAGLITMMQQLLNTESNGLVLANLLLSLQEISYMKGQLIPTISSDNLKKLLVAVNECAEWGQISILDQLSDYQAANDQEAELIIERVLPRLNHINPAVVLSTIKVVLRFLEYISKNELVDSILKKLTPSLVSLLNWDKPEVKYVILKSILHILQKRPNIMDEKLKSFFCFFNEPYYVKNEKLEVLVKICNEKNLDDLLNELSAYIAESDTEFVKRSIRALGSIAVRYDQACDKAFQIIVEVIKNIQSSQNVHSCSEYIQEIFITLQKIFRKYRVINPKNRDTMKLITPLISETYDPRSKASAAWIVGEYAEYIDDSLQIIQNMAENFSQEERLVQLEILTASVKIFVKYPQDSQQLIIHLLQVAAEDNLNPDVRDRAYMYWRMLATDPKKTQDTVLCNKPKIEELKIVTDPEFIEKMILTLGCVSSIFSKAPEEMFKHESIMRRKPIIISIDNLKKEISKKNNTSSISSEKSNEAKAPNSQGNIDLLDVGDHEPQIAPEIAQPQSQQSSKTQDLIDLIDAHDTIVPVQQAPNQISSPTKQQSGLDLYSISGIQVQQPIPIIVSQPAQPIQIQPLGGQQVEVDMFGDPIIPSQQPQIESFTEVPAEEVLKQDVKGNGGQSGLSVKANFINENNTVYLNLVMTNHTQVAISSFVLQIRQNYFGFKPEAFPNVSLNPQTTQAFKIKINNQGNKDPNPPSIPLLFTVGLKCSLDVFLFQVPCLYHIFMLPDGELSKEDFKKYWMGQPELSFEVKNNLNKNYYQENVIKAHLKRNNIFHVATRPSPSGQGTFFFSCKTGEDFIFCIEISYVSDTSCKVICKSKHQNFIPLVLQFFNFLLTRQ
ncbi:hypothetical protein ABPG72_012071 [Tetrahymena utriculariae]